MSQEHNAHCISDESDNDSSRQQQQKALPRRGLTRQESGNMPLKKRGRRNLSRNSGAPTGTAQPSTAAAQPQIAGAGPPAAAAAGLGLGPAAQRLVEALSGDPATRHLLAGLEQTLAEQHVRSTAQAQAQVQGQYSGNMSVASSLSPSADVSPFGSTFGTPQSAGSVGRQLIRHAAGMASGGLAVAPNLNALPSQQPRQAQAQSNQRNPAEVAQLKREMQEQVERMQRAVAQMEAQLLQPAQPQVPQVPQAQVTPQVPPQIQAQQRAQPAVPTQSPVPARQLIPQRTLSLSPTSTNTATGMHPSVHPHLATPILSATHRLNAYMLHSQQSLRQLQDYDKSQGLPASHCATMVKSYRSRKQLLTGKILKKWDGTPLIEFEDKGDGTVVVRSGDKKERRKNKKRPADKATESASAENAAVDEPSTKKVRRVSGPAIQPQKVVEAAAQ